MILVEVLLDQITKTKDQKMKVKSFMILMLTLVGFMVLSPPAETPVYAPQGVELVVDMNEAEIGPYTLVMSPDSGEFIRPATQSNDKINYEPLISKQDHSIRIDSRDLIYPLKPPKQLST